MKLRRACLVIGVCLVVAQLTSPPAQTIASAAEPATSATCQGGTPSDVDGNGVGDLIVSGASYKGSLVLVRNGDTREPLGLIGYPSDPQITFRSDYGPAAIGDLDGDGCADLVFTGFRPDVERGNEQRLYIVPGSPDGPAYEHAVWFAVPPGTVKAIALLPRSRKIVVGMDTGSDGVMLIEQLGPRLNLVDTTVVSGSSLHIKHKKARRAFASSLAADGNTIVVGSPRETWRGSDGAGAVYLFSAITLKHRRVTERSKGFATMYPGWSTFGCSVSYLDGRLAIGVCSGDNKLGHETGRVYLAKWNERKRTYKVTRNIAPGLKGVPGKSTGYSTFGCQVVLARGLTAPASYDVAISACQDQPNKTFGAGSITVTNFDRGGYQRFVQGSGGVPGSIGVNHQFGIELAVRHLSATSDALVATAFQDEPGTTCNHLVVTTSGGLLRTSTWSVLPSRSFDCRLGGWGQILVG